MAERFAHEGAAVVVADVSADPGEALAAEIVARGGRAVFVRTDVTRDADVQAMIDTAVARFARLDVLVNNAGIGRFVPFDELEPPEWDRIFAVNLRAVYAGCRSALPHLRRDGGGVILNVASQSGLQSQAMTEAYCASKAGVILLTRSLARELAPEGIRGTASVRAAPIRRCSAPSAGRSAPPTRRRRGRRSAASRARGDRGGGAVPRLRRGLVRHRGGAPGGRRQQPPRERSGSSRRRPPS
jgi:NAD(P)-dependent dehydrogenase (short-subunit alcohol dehydrogenase family)